MMHVDPDTGGMKGMKLVRYSLLPWDALEAIAEHFGKCGGDGTGPGKYSERNWERGYAWSLSRDAEERHMKAFWQDREDVDQDSQSLHLTAHAWHALTMLAMYLRGIGKDDRPI